MTNHASPPSSAWPARLLALAALGVLVISLAHPSSTRQFTWPWLPTLTLIWLMPLVVWLSAPRLHLSRDPFLLAGLTGLALATLASAAFSPFAPLSLPRVWPTLAGIALLLWLQGWLAHPAHPHRIGRITLGLAVGGAVLALFSLVRWRGSSVGIPWSVRNEIPFGHSNYTAGAMLLVLPWLALAAWQTAGLRRLAWGLAAFATLAVLFSTSSRAGALALAAVVAASAGLAVGRVPWSPRHKLALALAAILLLFLAVLANPRLRDLALGRGWSDHARASNTQRSAMLRAGWLLGQERPLLGWGPGTVPLTYPTVRAQLDGGTDNVLQLHNTPMQLWATLGSAGLLSLALLLTAIVRQGQRIWRDPHPINLAAAAALLAYGLFALTDHQLELPAFTTLLVVNLALFFRDGDRGSSRPVNLRFLPRLIMLAVLAVPLGFTLRDLQARHARERALDAFEAGDITESLTELELAAQRAPWDPYYRQQLADQFLVKRSATTDPTRREALGSAAAEQLRLSLAAGCGQEYAHLNLGWLALTANAPRLAANHFRAALRQAPHRSGAYFGLGVALRDAGHPTAAVRAFALEWVNDPAARTVLAWELPEFVLYRERVAREAATILAELIPAHPTAGYVRTLWHWWADGSVMPVHGFDAESTAFANALIALQEKRPLPTTTPGYPWGQLLVNWRDNPTDFSTLAPQNPALAAALVRRASQHPAPAVRAFLATPPDDDALISTTRSTRKGYGVLTLHPDGPAFADLYIRQEPLLVSKFASGVFPPRGWLPARVLLERLPPP